MDTQPTPVNPSLSPEQPAALRPEAMPGNVAPAPGAPAASPAATTPPPKLTAADVAAAIAATPTPGAQPTVVSAPSTAGDVDVIEPEWVAQAETAVAQHQGDPYGEEEAIEDLQQDYLQKRYGHTVADPNADSSKPEKT